MNHPTDELDDLLSCAEEAMADGDYDQAVIILRQANHVAPLRRDVRNMLAMALQGAPASTPRKKKHAAPPVSKPAPVVYFEPSEYPDEHELDDYYGDDQDSRHSAQQISEVTQNAFRAAADTTARVGAQTGSAISSLLQTGLKSWKSSFLSQISSLRKPAQQVDAGATVGSAEAQLFTHSPDIEQIMGPAPEASSVQMYRPLQEEPVLAEEEPEVERLVQPAKTVRKEARSSSSKSKSRPTDMEDVLAAGFGSLIEAAGNADKKKIGFAGIYMTLAVLFGFACYDAAKKFPEVEMVPGMGSVATANIGALDLSAVSTSPVAEARRLAGSGQPEAAVNLLKANLLDGKMHPANDPIRIELATQLNGIAEDKLRKSELKESVIYYREAVGVMPDDSGLALRLANSIYYYVTMGSLNSDEKSSVLKEGLGILDKLVARGSDNVQVYRLRALLQDAGGQTSQAKASWQKVKALAPENTAEHAEANSRLK